MSTALECALGLCVACIFVVALVTSPALRSAVLKDEQSKAGVDYENYGAE